MNVRNPGWMSFMSLGLLLASSADVPAQDVVKGAALMAAARQALGGDARLAGVKTLQVGGTFRRVIGTNDTDGDFDLFLEPPDKYLRSEKTGIPGQPSTETIEALVGTEVRDVVRGGAGRGGRGGGAFGGGAGGVGGAVAGGEPAPAVDGFPAVDSGDAGAAAGTDADQRGDADGGGAGRGRGSVGADPETQRRLRQADVARWLTLWLLRIDVPVTWIGIAESPDGKADVLEATFADGQPTRLFLDITSHMPLMMQWRGMPPRVGGVGGRRGGRGQGGRGRGGEPGAAEFPGQRQGGPPEPLTYDMTFSDHRVVNGIKLPYVITRGINGKTIERWTVKTYRVNPSFSADTFTR